MHEARDGAITDPEDASRFRNAFEDARIGMALVDPQGRFLEINRTFCELLGYEESEMLGRPFGDFTHPDDRESNLQLVRDLLDGKIPGRQIEKRYVRKDGELVWALLSTTLKRDPEGRPSYFITQVIDITERRDTEEQLRLTRNAVERANRAKSDFLASMSHEIRTPMHAILGMVDLLERGELGEDEQGFAGRIRTSAEGLLQLIDQILDISKIEAGRLTLDNEAFRLRDLLDDLIELLRPRAEAKGIALKLSLSADVPASIEGDPHRLRQVLLNLLSNAVKHTEKGFVFLSVTLAREPPRTADGPEGVSWVRFAVRDTGVGIAPEDLARIFEPFVQVGASSRREGGTGLGLVISQRLVELLGGEITVTSTPGQGSSFIAVLPFPEANEPVEEMAPARPTLPRLTDQPSRTRFRVLVAEDDEMGRFLAVRFLEEAGYVVDTAENGRATLEKLGRSAYDLVLLDCQMPELDGFETARRIRRRESEGRAGRLPIVAVTARAMKGDREKCLAAGMDDFVAKPYRAAELIRTVDRQFGLHRPEGWKPPSAPRKQAGNGRRSSIDASILSQVRSLLSRSSERRPEDLFEGFLDQRQDRCRELRDALQRSESLRLANLAHTLISTSGSLGAYRLAKLAGEVEIQARQSAFDACASLIDDLEAEYSKVEAELREALGV